VLLVLGNKMALYITCKNDTADSAEMHLYDGRLKHCRTDDAVKVQADGDELDRISRTFTNIPMPGSSVVTWRGEMAQFIAEHLT
jgi:hypothetical protein